MRLVAARKLPLLTHWRCLLASSDAGLTLERNLPVAVADLLDATKSGMWSRSLQSWSHPEATRQSSSCRPQSATAQGPQSLQALAHPAGIGLRSLLFISLPLNPWTMDARKGNVSHQQAEWEGQCQNGQSWQDFWSTGSGSTCCCKSNWKTSTKGSQRPHEVPAVQDQDARGVLF